ncbi:hypothetical protein OQA88_8160 [Cercophora sp. LCS_1]
MASTAPAIAESEIPDPPSVLSKKIATLTTLIRKSKHLIVFTGAGISTSAGIADFRGPTGVWTLRAQGRDDAIRSVNTLQAIPTPAHMALVTLQNAGIMKHLVSQNCDGLHRRSGINPETISELHGNSNRECCGKCNKEYIRDFRAVAAYERTVHDHRTGRKCAVAACGGNLYDTIVNFGENLPLIPIEDARMHAQKADLCLVLGSSLTVSPANEIPETVGERKGAKTVIVNLQSTPVDGVAEFRIAAKADEVMRRVMEGLGLEIPPFVLRRRLVVEVNAKGVTLRGVDVDGTPVTFIKSVRMPGNRRVASKEPFTIGWRGELEVGKEVEVEMEFMGHYGEPNLTIKHVYGGEEGGKLYHLSYSPTSREWVVEVADGNAV